MKFMLLLVGLVLLVTCSVISPNDMAQAEEILGVGTDSLLGGDLTDPEDDGDPEADKNYNAKFSGNEEAGFAGGESAFNVFDNRLGGGNDKWCCGRGGGFPDEGLYVTVELDEVYALTHFTVSSANDIPDRDPTEWEIQGSNNGEDFDTIYSHEGDSFWPQRLQVVLFEAGEDYEKPKIGYKFFRHVTFNTVLNPNGAYFQIGEIEYFGDGSYAVDPIGKLTTKWGSLKRSR